MKKSIMFLALLMATMTTFAYRIDTLGWCSGNAYFKTHSLQNTTLQVRMFGETGIAFQFSNNHITDTVFTLPQDIQFYPIRIQFRYKTIGSPDSTYTSWHNNDWANGYVQSGVHSSCSVLAVSFTNFTATRQGNKLNINFTNEDESGVDHYYLLLSKDGSHWDKVGQPIKATGQQSYTFTYSLGTVAAFGFLLPLFIGFKRKRLFYLIPLAALIFFFSCQKESTKIGIDNNYHYARIQADDGNTFTNVVRF